MIPAATFGDSDEAMNHADARKAAGLAPLCGKCSTPLLSSSSLARGFCAVCLRAPMGPTHDDLLAAVDLLRSHCEAETDPEASAAAIMLRRFIRGTMPSLGRPVPATGEHERHDVRRLNVPAGDLAPGGWFDYCRTCRETVTRS